MKSAKRYQKYALALISLLLMFGLSSFSVFTDGNTDKKKKEKIKELSYDNTIIARGIVDFEEYAGPKIKIFNANDVLVYEDSVESLEDIKENNLRNCFKNCTFLIQHNNIKYYIISN